MSNESWSNSENIFKYEGLTWHNKDKELSWLKN